MLGTIILTFKLSNFSHFDHENISLYLVVKLMQRKRQIIDSFQVIFSHLKEINLLRNVVNNNQ